MKKIIMARDGQQPELCVQVADTFLSRLRGLMLRTPSSLPLGTGLLIAPCTSIHMMFMRFAIDVVYVSEQYEVIKCVKNVLPWIGISASFDRKAWGVLELPRGSIERFSIRKGQIWEIVHKDGW
ncbi:DUF192 domain-containing protein [Anaerovibrio sp.]|uniref:DUF192 domain-containing protein n=1 Tax=Anaerovibrio sp. TaxID=1872532 RepID=UPI003F14C1E0